jgi:uncharacterized protein (DUF1330 family)
MAGYLIVDVEIVDPTGYDEYRAIAPEILRRYDGKVIVRGGRSESVEGGWAPKRLVVVQFPSYEQARSFYYSAGYQKVLPKRLSSARCRGILIEGE